MVTRPLRLRRKGNLYFSCRISMPQREIMLELMIHRKSTTMSYGLLTRFSIPGHS